MKVSIFSDKDFRYKDCKELFYKSNETLEEALDFDGLIKKYQLFQYTHENKLIGCLYYYFEDDKLFVATFANKGFAEEKYKCLKESLTYYDCDIYARTKQRHVAIALLRCGFKKISDNLYKYER